jgi:hypothetical protein
MMVTEPPMATEQRAATESYPSSPQPYSVPFDPPAPQPVRRRGRGIVLLVILGSLVLVLALAALCSGGSHTNGVSDSPAITSGHRTSAPRATTPDPTIPSQTAGPACYPFQPGCPG